MSVETPLKEDARKKKKRRRASDEMDLMEHLDELRARLFRCIFVILLCGIVAWYWLYHPVVNALTRPLNIILASHHIKARIIYVTLVEPFMLQLKICAMLAVAMASPFILWEAWGFVAPGLHPHERRPFKFVFPLAVFLFCMGAGLSYYILPAAFAWFLSYLPMDPNVEFMPKMQDYLLFVVKMCGAFGVGFELPVVLMFLGKIGLVSSKTMRRYWRQAVVIIMLAAAILTPSNDPFSMLMMATPMAILYLASIGLVKWVEPKFEITEYGSDAKEETPSRHPKPIDPDEED
jgi:sec-independent protein translocase protein TatC